MIITLVACYEGLSTDGGAEGVGRATTRSVVISFIAIIIADAILTSIFYFART
jgi:phospholipid/cholesterol/gamma-HCH transport system permease protein